MSDKPDLILELLTDLQAGQRQFRDEMHEFRRETRANFGVVFERLGSVEDRLGALEDRLGVVEGRIGALEALVQQLARRVDGLTHDVVGLRREAASLRQSLTEYHGAVLGHGVLISELDERLSRVERHLGLVPG